MELPMRTLLLMMVLNSLASADGARWKLVWVDEFDKPGAPDASKWSYEKGLVRNKEKQFYTVDRRENARIEDGKLIIEAHKQAMEGGDFTSASLITKGKAEWKYGRVEVKAKLPAARGSWPAIWMMPGDKNKIRWPDCGEIDIMEHVGFDPGKIHGTLHSGAFNHTKRTQRTGNLMVPDFATDFHVYAMEWTENKIVMEVDGKSYVTFEKKAGDTAAEWPFEKPFYLILNLAVGGGWGGLKGIDDAAFPQRMEIDFVRIYQEDSSR